MKHYRKNIHTTATSFSRICQLEKGLLCGMMKLTVMINLVIICILPQGIHGGSVSHTFSFSKSDLTFEKYEEYDVVQMNNAGGESQPGNPDLPVIVNYFVIPPTSEIDKIEIVDNTMEQIKGTFNVRPAQEPVQYSKAVLTKRTAPNLSIYTSKNRYPENIIETSFTGSSSGFRIAGIRISPIQYKPSVGELFLTTSAKVTVHYREGVHSTAPISIRQYQEMIPVVRKMIKNPADLAKCSPPVRSDVKGDVNYAVITDEAFKGEFEAFKFWKTKKGLRTEVFTTAWIYNKYSGYDNAEKVRNFLIDYHKNKGLVYTLLAGDYDKVPHRMIKVRMDPGDLGSDYYFGDLDGTWDSNNNHEYSETRLDTIDGYLDIFTGRIPIDKPEQVGYFVHKDTTMEKNPPQANLKKYLLVSAPLSTVKHGRELNNQLADLSPQGWMDIKLEDPSRYALRDSINKGFYFININSHGFIQEFVKEVNVPMLHSDDIGAMSSRSNSFPILYSLACHVGEFYDPSQDAIGELLINQPNGGCAAAILNSRLGWFSPEVGKNQGTDLLSLQFAAMFFEKDTGNIGQALTATKHLHVEKAWRNLDFMMHYCINELTLFGDPDLPLYRDIPVKLSAVHSGSIPAGQQTFKVNVKTVAPVKGALVCCYKENELYQTSYTDANGDVNLAINPVSSGTMHVTATVKNQLPYEGKCSINGITQNSIAHAFHSNTGIKLANEKGMVSIRFSLTHPSEVHGTLHDANGAVVKRIKNANWLSGTHSLQLQGLRTGIYLLKITISGIEQKEKFVFLR